MGMYAVAHALRDAGHADLSRRFFDYLAYMSKNAQTVFYRGGGNVSWVTTIVDPQAMPHAGNYFGSSNPGDPYEVLVVEVDFGSQS